MGTRVDALIKWILGAKISHEDFVEKSVWSNQIALRIGTAFGVLFELCNICRVLFFSNIGTLPITAVTSDFIWSILSAVLHF